jgi:ribosome recycling factor
VEVRSLRRDANEVAKKMQKEGKLTEDELTRSTKDVQKLTDDAIKEIDNLLKGKEAELMQV